MSSPIRNLRELTALARRRGELAAAEHDYSRAAAHLDLFYGLCRLQRGAIPSEVAR